MRVVRAIARRELAALLHTTTGWLVLTGFLLATGVLWLALVDAYAVASTDVVYQPYAAQRMNLTDHLLAPFFGNLVILLLVVAPAVSMRLYADEQRLGTAELLASAPITPTQIVLGKFLGALGFTWLAVACTAWMPLSLVWASTPDPGAIVGGYLAVGLLSAAVLALGGLASAVTDSQVVALVLAFAATLSLWVLGWVDPDPTSWASALSLRTHVTDLPRGLLRLSDVAYFVLLTAVALFATHQRVDAWKVT